MIPSRAGVIRHPSWHVGRGTVTVAAAAAAIVILAAAADGDMLDYGVGVVPAPVPWLAAGLAIVAAFTASSARGSPSAAGSWQLGVTTVATAWSVVMLPFDVLRIVGLVPLPLHLGGMCLRLLLLIAAGAVLVPALQARRAGHERCPSCGRVVPGRLDRVPAWPGVVAVAAALVYPALRTVWAFGGTFGTIGEPLDLEPAVAWGAAAAGWVLVAVAVVLLAGHGPRWARALLGLGGVAVGAGMILIGGLAGVLAATMLATEGLQSTQGDGLMTWVFLLVYGLWFLAGLNLVAAAWRYWARRRMDCPTCAMRMT